MPDARFVIAGRNPTAEVQQLADRPGVEVLGEVPDMSAVLKQAWVAVAPMRTGAGIKNKVLEAWAVGTPVVMSAAAANGLSLDADGGGAGDGRPARMAEIIAALLDGRGQAPAAGRRRAPPGHGPRLGKRQRGKSRDLLHQASRPA